MHAALSFEQAPPLTVPIRFFATAPWFGVAAGLLLLWQGPEALASRWSPATMALTHLMTAGLMLQGMCGALLQFVPVAVGGNVWRPRLVAAVLHPALALAALLLPAAFLSADRTLLCAAAALFAVALGGFIAVVGLALLRTAATGASIATLRVALFGLLATVPLGLAAAATLGGALALPLAATVNLHASWGLGGWALALLAAAAFSVVPMFQLTPNYPAWVKRAVPFGLLAALAVLSLQALIPGAPADPRPWQGLGLICAGGFAVATLRLQQRRRRRVVDPTFGFFRGAMVSLLLASASGLTMLALPQLAGQPAAALWLGILLIVGVFASAINGMIYKIVPFLYWLHLQRLGGPAAMLPNMRALISERSMRGQMALHFIALALLLAALALPALARPGGAVLAASCAWLGGNVIGAYRVYAAFNSRIRASAARRES